MEEPLSSERWGYEPGLGRPASPDTWRVLTNFVEAKDILGRFGVWPDDVLTPERLGALYLGKRCDDGGPFATGSGPASQPAFPFLDGGEESAIASIWERRKGPLGAGLRQDLAGVVPHSGWTLLALQSLIILEMRAREAESGVWQLRSSGQKMGSLFAVRPGASTLTCRVETIPLAGDSVICVPWGGPFAEYSKVLQLVGNRYTRQVIESADKDLEVVPEGHVLKLMVAAGLVRELRQSFMDAHWVLSAPALEWRDVRDGIPGIREAARAISFAAAEEVTGIIDLMRASRYATLEGHGDYLEMAYQVLVGLLFQWASEDGLLRPAPRFRDTGRGPVLDRPRNTGRESPDLLPGIAIVRGAAPAWDCLLASNS